MMNEINQMNQTGQTPLQTAWNRRRVMSPLYGVLSMSKSVAELEQEARHFPTQDRALLAQHLIASIDPGEDVTRKQRGWRKLKNATKRTVRGN